MNKSKTNQKKSHKEIAKKQVWRPKKIDEVVSKPKQTKTIQVWKPKAEQLQKDPHRVESLLAPQEQKPKERCLQALDIQIKLFGYTSVLLSEEVSWNLYKSNKLIGSYRNFLAH